MKHVLILSCLLLMSVELLGCGPWGCYTTVCQNYGPVDLGDYDLDLCAPNQLNHLDPNNLSETNFKILWWELTGAKKKSDEKYIQFPMFMDNSAEQEKFFDSEKDTFYAKGVLAMRERNFIQAIEFLNKALQESTILAEKKARAQYYIGRCYLIHAQANYDGYINNTSQVDKGLLENSKKAFQQFLDNYKGHDWNESAEGLIRRANFLSQNLELYLESWGNSVEKALTAHPRNEAKLAQLFNEISLLDIKKIIEAKKLHPILWVIKSFFVTRQFPTMEKPAYNVGDILKDLESSKDEFKIHPDLFVWAKSVLLLKLEKYKEGLEIIQKNSLDKSNQGSLSWVVLMARLNMGLGKFEEARLRLSQFLKSNPVVKKEKNKNDLDPSDLGFKDYLFYHLQSPVSGDQSPYDVIANAREFFAMTYVWEKNNKKFLSEENFNKIGSEIFEKIYIQNASSDEMIDFLKTDIKSSELRLIAEKLSFTRMLARGEWEKATQVFSLIKTPKLKTEFEALNKSAQALMKDNKNAEANARVGMYISNIEPGYHIFAKCKKNQFDKKEIASPMSLYTKSIESFKAEEKAGLKKNPIEALLLKKLLYCFKPHLGAPYCGEDYYTDQQAFDLAMRKSWFKRLKTRFPESKEAKEQRVFW